AEGNAEGGEFAPPAHADPEEAMRTRRIQEEIRRKIAERSSGGPLTAPAPPLFRENPVAPRPVAVPLPPRTIYREPPALQASPASTAAILERQLELEEQMRALEDSRRSAQRKAAALAAQTAVLQPPPARGELLQELRGAQNLRRAMLLREVLGPPVALR
ncbi:MAG: hypothetical protein KBF26_12720, partial [Opitutaceae bacterium]|nr:hypothetical protein [Opitutaceae bacterium]